MSFGAAAAAGAFGSAAALADDVAEGTADVAIVDGVGASGATEPASLGASATAGDGPGSLGLLAVLHAPVAPRSRIAARTRGFAACQRRADREEWELIA